MTSSRRLRFTAKSRADLRSVLRYSLRAWGESQRDAYADRLNAAMRQLTTYPELGRARDDVLPGLRGLPVGEHVVYYRISDQAILVVRILHGRMDAAGQFQHS